MARRRSPKARSRGQSPEHSAADATATTPTPAEVSEEPAPTPAFYGRRDLIFAVTILVAVLLAYRPAWNGAFIWDDDGHVTRPELRSWEGLSRIWIDVEATQQYYPLLHSAFWLQHRCWGDTTLGYHLVNILLHASAAVLATLILRRLNIPGAYLAGAIFALHPVHVESVAWVTELKNSLSAVFYLGAALVYLRFRRTRVKRWYLVALGLFVSGMLSKTVTATLPAALLVVFWWQDGRLSWRRDVLPLIPFFAIGAVGGIFTAWVERTLIGASAEVVDLTIIERCLMAGRVVWFYLGKLLWPTNLTFIYPRWEIDQRQWWQYLFLIALLLALAGLWRFRTRARGPLAGVLFFIGTLFPVLGFLNVFPFRYSFVADHFQYLASLGMIALAASGIVLLLRRWSIADQLPGYGVYFVLLSSLTVLTWHQAGMYADVETLYRTTIARNPDCWMAYDNLGVALASRGEIDLAVQQFEKAIEIKPDHGEAHNNLGNALQRQGRLDEALIHANQAVEIQPHVAMVHFNRANILKALGRIDAAIASYRRSLKLDPEYTKCHINLGIALLGNEQLDEAAGQFERALEIQPEHVGARQNLGVVRLQQGKHAQALACWREVLRADPNRLMVLNQSARLLAASPDVAVRDGAQAVILAERAVQLSQAADPGILDTLAMSYAAAGRFADAVQAAQAAYQRATAQGNATFAEAMTARIKAYQAGQLTQDSGGESNESSKQ